jgi:hypothetical protein
MAETLILSLVADPDPALSMSDDDKERVERMQRTFFEGTSRDT